MQGFMLFFCNVLKTIINHQNKLRAVRTKKYDIM